MKFVGIPNSIMYLFGISRKRYKRSEITFRSIADLRRKLSSEHTLNTLQLIKSFVEKFKNENENTNLVKYSSWNVFDFN